MRLNVSVEARELAACPFSQVEVDPAQTVEQPWLDQLLQSLLQVGDGQIDPRRIIG
jgi:hypothetical protein